MVSAKLLKIFPHRERGQVQLPPSKVFMRLAAHSMRAGVQLASELHCRLAELSAATRPDTPARVRDGNTSLRSLIDQFNAAGDDKWV